MRASNRNRATPHFPEHGKIFHSLILWTAEETLSLDPYSLAVSPAVGAPQRPFFKVTRCYEGGYNLVYPPSLRLARWSGGILT
jgi:hypothetical protein